MTLVFQNPVKNELFSQCFPIHLPIVYPELSHPIFPMMDVELADGSSSRIDACGQKKPWRTRGLSWLRPPLRSRRRLILPNEEWQGIGTTLRKQRKLEVENRCCEHIEFLESMATLVPRTGRIHFKAVPSQSAQRDGERVNFEALDSNEFMVCHHFGMCSTLFSVEDQLNVWIITDEQFCRINRVYQLYWFIDLLVFIGIPYSWYLFWFIVNPLQRVNFGCKTPGLNHPPGPEGRECCTAAVGQGATRWVFHPWQPGPPRGQQRSEYFQQSLNQS